MMLNPPAGGQRRIALIDQLLADQRDASAVERFAQAKEGGGLPADAAHYRSLLPARGPSAGEQYAFEVDLDQCSGCKACVTACHSLNGLEPTETWRGVGLLISPHEPPLRGLLPRGGGEGGSAAEAEPDEGISPEFMAPIHGQPQEFTPPRLGYPVPASAPAPLHVTTACHHCVDPACLSGCPVLAYDKDPVTGIVRHLDDQCIGCQYCVMKCPYEVPRYSERLGIVRKCDMCSGRLAAGEAPACVQACPSQAIRITLVEVKAIAEELTASARTHVALREPPSAGALSAAEAGERVVPTRAQAKSEPGEVEQSTVHGPNSRASLQIPTFHEPPLRGLLPRGGGEGGSASEAEPDEGSSSEFMAPIRVRQQVETSHARVKKAQFLAGGLFRTEQEALQKPVRRDSSLNVFLPDSPDPAITLPTTRYRSSKPLLSGLHAADRGALRLEPSHWSLVVMLVLTQAAAGLILITALADLADGARVPRAMPFASLGLLAAGLTAAVFHLGQPLKAWRSFLGWRTSWLSRELIAFHAFAACAVPAALTPALFWPAAALGLAAVGTSAMVYVDTRRPFWSGPRVFLSFLGTTLLLGASLGAVAFAWTGDVVRTEASVLLAALTGGALFAWRRLEVIRAMRNAASPIHVNARVMTELLPRPIAWSAGLFMVAVAFGTLAVARIGGSPAFWTVLASGAALASELLARRIFFAASASKRMPGGVIA